MSRLAELPTEKKQNVCVFTFDLDEDTVIVTEKYRCKTAYRHQKDNCFSK